MKKLFILIFILIISISISANTHYLTDPENKNISNNNIVLNTNSKIIHLKFLSDCDSIYYVIWPNGEDTIKIERDDNGIYKIPLNPRKLSIGNYFIEILNNRKEKELNFYFRIKKNISVFSIILNLFFGLVLFMLGLKFSSKGLSRISGYRLKEILWNLSDSQYKGVISGLILTLMLQSSTVFSVMITSFVSDGLIGIIGAVSMLAGSAIGTAIVVQIIAFNISFFSFIMIIIGFYLYDRIKRFKQMGLIIMGFGFIFYSIQLMAGAILPIKDTTSFQHILLFLQSNSIILFVLVSLFTFSVHSSAVIIALIMGFSIAGLIPFNGAIIMIAAANLGTTFTATLASLRGDNKAKYVAIVNVIMKLIAGAIFIILAFYFKNILFDKFNNSRGIANLHLIFNLIFATLIILFIPLINYFGKLYKNKEMTMIEKKILNESMQQTPSIAIGHIMREITKMADIAYDMLEKSFVVMKTNDLNLLNEIILEDDKIDKYEKEITMFLISLSEEEITANISAKIKSMFFIVDEIEHIGDIISKNLMVNARKKIENNYYFSEEGFQDIKKMYLSVMKTYQMVFSIMTEYNEGVIEEILQRRESVLAFLQKLHVKHLERLENAVKESIETSTIHLDILSDYERINFHSYKICVFIKEKENI